MKLDKIKKIPLPLSSLVLGQLGMGNLLAVYHPLLRYTFGGLAVIYLSLLILSLIFHWKEHRAEFSNPPLVSSFATFPMSLILLSGYIRSIPLLSDLAPFFWWGGLLLDVSLIFYFSIHFLFPYKKENLTPSWTVLYVGIAIASLTVEVTKQYLLAKVILGYGLLSSLLLFVLLVDKFGKEELPKELAAQLVIIAAPLSLLLASFIQVGTKGNFQFLLFSLLVISQLLYVFSMRQLFIIVKDPFYPSWSALTFPLVISALALRLSLGHFGWDIFPLNMIVKLEELIALSTLLCVTYSYIRFLKKMS